MKVGDLVHCRHAQADGRVIGVYSTTVTVIVTWTTGSSYEIGKEYAWFPIHLVRLDEAEFN